MELIDTKKNHLFYGIYEYSKTTIIHQIFSQVHMYMSDRI